jgi:hypothetical protein
MENKQSVIKPFCRRCEYFCGKTYMVTLVCAPHPYGPEGDTCADWQPAARPDLLAEPDMEIEIVWANPNRRWWERLVAGLRRRWGQHG